MKISVSSYSFQKLINAGIMTQLDCVAKAKEMGFDAVEFTDLKPPEGVTAEQYAAQIREQCDRHDLPVSNYTVWADFLKNEPESEKERLCRQVDIAGILGTSSMRHDATTGWPDGNDTLTFNDALSVLTDGCRAVTEYAAEKEIRTMVENHGLFCQDSERVERLMKAVGHPNFGWLVDIGNFACADENSFTAVRRALPYAVYVHAKDFYVRNPNGDNPGRGFWRSRGGAYLRSAVVGQGDIDAIACLRLIRESGYTGFIGLEFEGIEDALWGIEAGLENLRQFLAE